MILQNVSLSDNEEQNNRALLTISIIIIFYHDMSRFIIYFVLFQNLEEIRMVAPRVYLCSLLLSAYSKGN